ncbi:MAG: DUF4235 domain-containing protein [Thermodesulfobacteriota bacterium]
MLKKLSFKGKRWVLFSTGTTILAGILARSTIEKSWKLATKKPPPVNPASPKVDWLEAISWTAATGIGVSLGRLAARRGAAAAWKRTTGRRPPLRRQQ